MASVELHEYLNLTQAAKLVPGKPHPSTLHRWRDRGIGGRDGQRVRLKTVRFGYNVYTTRDWLQQFAEAVDEACAKSDVQPITRTRSSRNPRLRLPSRRQRDIQRAKKRLQDAGIA